jgi:hypothetical protein
MNAFAALGWGASYGDGNGSAGLPSIGGDTCAPSGSRELGVRCTWASKCRFSSHRSRYGAGVGLKDATNIGLLAANRQEVIPLFHPRGKDMFFNLPTSVGRCMAGRGCHDNQVFHLGSVKFISAWDNRPEHTSSVL